MTAPAPHPQNRASRAAPWPGPAKALRAGRARVRPSPGTAKGVNFLPLEDETGTANLVGWANVYKGFRRAVLPGGWCG